MAERFLEGDELNKLGRIIKGAYQAVEKSSGVGVEENLYLGLLQLEIAFERQATDTRVSVGRVTGLLLDHPLTASLQGMLSRHLDIIISPEETERHTRVKAREFVNAKGCQTKRNGHKFLTDILESNQAEKKSALKIDTELAIQNRLAVLKQVVRSADPEQVGLIDFLFYLLADQPPRSSKAPGIEALVTLERIIKFQVDENPEFLDELTQFIGVYADVSQALLENDCFADKEQQREMMASFLQKILRNSSLISDPDVSLEDTHQAMWKADHKNHPWINPDAPEDLFDIAALPKFISQDIPIEPLINALTMRNRHPLPLLVTELAYLFHALNRDQKRGNRTIPDEKIVRINRLFEATAAANIPEIDLPNILDSEPVQQLKVLIDVLSPFEDLLAPIQSSSEAETAFIGYEVLIRALNPKSIITLPEARERFYMMIGTIVTKAMDYARKHEKKRPVNPLLARSLFDILANQDGVLDVPIPESERTTTIRILMAQIANDVLPHDIIKNGPYAPDHKKVPKGFEDKPHIISPLEAQMTTSDSRSFKTAMIGVDRPFLATAAKAMNELYDYDNTLAWCQDEFREHFKVPDHEVAFFSSGTQAMAGFVHALSEQNPQRRIVLHPSTQEYQDSVDLFGNARATMAAAISLYNQDGTPKDVQQLSDDYAQSVVAHDQKADSPETADIHVSLLSFVTRFGMAPMSRAEDHTPHEEMMNEFVRRVRQKTTEAGIQTVLMVEDHAQSTGRYHLTIEREADVINHSGRKAEGAGGGGAISLKSSEQNTSLIDMSRLPGGSKDIEYFTANAIGWLYGRYPIDLWNGSFTLGGYKGTAGRRTLFPMKKQIAYKMRTLTTQALEMIKKSGEVAASNQFLLFGREKPGVNPQKIDLDQARKLLRWKFEGTYDKQSPEAGIGLITFTVPGIKTKALVDKLMAYRSGGRKALLVDTLTIPANGGEEARDVIRISFHYHFTTPELVTELLEVISVIQVQSISEQRRGEPFNNLVQLKIFLEQIEREGRVA